MSKFERKKDIEDAINMLINGDSSIFGCHATSSIYPFTNEALNEYIEYFNKRERMLSVIGSGDQIFNAILSGTESVEAFDISKFVKYYFYLKKAAIEALTREEFIDMFITSRSDLKIISEADIKKYRTYFEKISYRLDLDVWHFWKDLLKISGWDWSCLYYSELFRCMEINPSKVMQTNSYLEEKNYSKLHSLLKDARINIRTGDILTLSDDYSMKEFDLIYLSNIHFYMNRYSFLYVLEKFKLSKNGIIIAYSFRTNDERLEYFGGKIKKLTNNESLMIRSNSLTNR